MTQHIDDRDAPGTENEKERDANQDVVSTSLTSEPRYRCIAASVAGFIQQVAVSYIRTGHFFYVAGELKPGADPAAVDAKLVHKYGVHATRWARALRKVRGEANLQYIRYGRFFLLMATHGRSLFFEFEGENVKDCRRMPIKFAGYSLSYRNGHPHVRIDLQTYLGFKASMVDFALRTDRAGLEELLAMPRFVPYAPVRRQLLNVLREVNRVRLAAGLDRVDERCLPLRRTIVRPFGDEDLTTVLVTHEQLAGWDDALLPVAAERDSERIQKLRPDLEPRRLTGVPLRPRVDAEETQSGATDKGLLARPTAFPADWSDKTDTVEATTSSSSVEGNSPNGLDRPKGIQR